MIIKKMSLILILGSLIIFAPIYGENLSDNSLKVVIFGTGKISGQPELYDQEILAKMLFRIKKENPNIIFFTGDLIQGLEQSTSPESLRIFENNLRIFSQLVKTYIGDEIPVYPLMGNHTLVNSEAVNIFRKHFNISNPAPLESYQLAYSVTEKNANFTVLATGTFERKFRGYGYVSRSMPILDWVEKNVRSGKDEIDFLFVIGHEPAFSSDTTAILFTNAENGGDERDLFWKILKDNKVTGYFCSHELIYDRSNRNGVWQVISGGIGDPKRLPAEADMFRHYVLLTIPTNRNENPQAKAIDINGRGWDEFSMTPLDRPVHHLRISQN